MLSKKNRITRSEFEGIIKTGKRFYSPIFTLYVKKEEKITTKKIAFSVSKKICKSAVERNKLRKQGYGAMREFLNKIKPGLSLVFVYKKGTQTPKYKEIKEDVKELLRSSFVII